MKLINNLFVITLIFFQTSIFAQQIGALEINEENVSNWFEKDIEKYEGIYHFGEGDGSNLSLIINDNKVIIQIRNTEYWTQGGYAVEAGIANLSELEMKWEYKNLSGIKIENGKFYDGLVCEAKNINTDYTFVFDYVGNGYGHDNYFKTGNYFGWNSDSKKTAQVTLHKVVTNHY